MRYSDIDVQCEDIMWFGVDCNGWIVACTSAGIGCVPEFVCKSREENETLQDFFCSDFDECHSNDDASQLSQKGLYYFDADLSNNGDSYIKVSEPTTPQTLDSLPTNIKKLMKERVINVDLSAEYSFTIKHAY